MDFIHAHGRRYCLRAYHERPAPGAWRAPFPDSVLRELGRDPFAGPGLWRALGGLEHRSWSRSEHGDALQRLRRAIEDGRLVLEELPRPRAAPRTTAATAPEQTAPEPAAVEPEVADWIEIELVDPKGNPVPHQRFELSTKSGARRSGTLNENGWARVEGLPPGACKVSFPDWDARSWRAA